MKLYFYRGKYPNFGDELNNWLLPKVFPHFFDDSDAYLFLGIGSILIDTHPEHCQKIVFGAGYGGYTPLPVFDNHWKIYCVRGPRTASACGFGADKVAGDAAILINRYRARPAQPGRKISFMPHWESLDRGYWQAACQLAGIHFIDPRLPVEEVLSDIEHSRMLITEAMHGAIVADALRVPWIPTLPIHHSHRFKWFDWAEALDMTLSPRSLWPSSAREAYLAVTQNTKYGLEHPRPGMKAMAIKCADQVCITLAAARLWQLARQEPMLSTDSALDRSLDRLETQAAHIKKDFAAVIS